MDIVANTSAMLRCEARQNFSHFGRLCFVLEESVATAFSDFDMAPSPLLVRKPLISTTCLRRRDLAAIGDSDRYSKGDSRQFLSKTKRMLEAESLHPSESGAGKDGAPSGRIRLAQLPDLPIWPRRPKSTYLARLGNGVTRAFSKLPDCATRLSAICRARNSRSTSVSAGGGHLEDCQASRIEKGGRLEVEPGAGAAGETMLDQQPAHES